MSHTVRNAPTTVRSAGPGVGGKERVHSGRESKGCEAGKGGLSSSERDVPSLQPHTFWLLNLLQGPVISGPERELQRTASPAPMCCPSSAYQEHSRLPRAARPAASGCQLGASPAARRRVSAGIPDDHSPHGEGEPGTESRSPGPNQGNLQIRGWEPPAGLSATPS